MEEALRVFGINWKLLLTQAINFGVVLTVLFFVLYKPLLRVLEERRERIKKGVEDARAAESARTSAEAEGKRVVALAAKTAEQTVAEARTKAQKEESDIVARAQTEGERIIHEANLRAEEEKKTILAEGKEEIARMIVLGAERVIQKHETR